MMHRLVILAGAGSALLLLGAYGFEYFGYAPCKLCYWQRWPHFVAVALAGLYLPTKWRIFLALGAVAAFTTSFIGAYHAGIEIGWWDGPQSCTGGARDLSNLSGESLLSIEVAKAPPQCDMPAWKFLGLSMAMWNAMFSALLCLIWFKALVTGNTRQAL